MMRDTTCLVYVGDTQCASTGGLINFVCNKVNITVVVMALQMVMAHSFATLTRAFSDQFEVPGAAAGRRSPSATVATTTTRHRKDHHNVDVVVHLTGGRVLRPVLVHPGKSRRSASAILPSQSAQLPSSSTRSSGGSQTIDCELAGGSDDVGSDLVRPRSQINTADTDSSTTSVRCSTSPNASFDVPGGDPPVYDAATTSSDVLGGRRTLQVLRADSEPRTRSELDRYSPLLDCRNAIPSVVFSVDNMMHPCENAVDNNSAMAAVAAAEPDSNAVQARSRDTSAQKRIKYRRSAKAHRRRMESATSEMASSIAGGNSAENDRLLSTSTNASELAVGRRSRTRLHINVSGQYFEIGLRALARHPKTLLGDGARRMRYYDAERDEFFFDRHRPSFEAIFAYYQTGGRLRRPFNVPDDIFLDELLFYELEQDAVDDYKRSEGYAFEDPPMPVNQLQRRIWTLFEYPETSRPAFFIAVLSVVMTLISIVLFCIETLPVFATTHCVAGELPNFLDPFFIIETTCTVWFTIEAIVRFASCPSKVAFWKDFKNIVDVTAVLPYYVTLFNVLWSMSCEGAKSSASLSFLRVIRLVRVFKLTKHSVGLQVLVLTFKASLEGLGLFLVALFVSLLVFSSAIYYAELGQPNSQMSSIPDAFWWAIITMTTVGYGDKVPVGPTGRLIGAACAITGVLTLAIPVPIITGHFNRFYSHKTGRGRHA